MTIIVLTEDEWSSLSEEQKNQVKFENDRIELVLNNGESEIILGEE